MLRPPPRPTLFPYTTLFRSLHQHTGLVVERAERLVEQQDLGIIGERTRNGAALLHAAGQLLRPVVLEAVQPNLLDETVGECEYADDRREDQPCDHVGNTQDVNNLQLSRRVRRIKDYAEGREQEELVYFHQA